MTHQMLVEARAPVVLVEVEDLRLRQRRAAEPVREAVEVVAEAVQHLQR